MRIYFFIHLLSSVALFRNKNLKMNSKHKREDSKEPVVVLKQYEDIATRRKSFELFHADNISIDVNECIRAGLVFMQTERQLICVYCKVKINLNDVKKDGAFATHSHSNPKCLYLDWYIKRTLTLCNDVKETVNIKSANTNTIGKNSFASEEWENTSLVNFAYETGYSRELVQKTLQKIKSLQQDLNIDTFWNTLFELCDTSSDFGVTESTYISGKSKVDISNRGSVPEEWEYSSLLNFALENGYSHDLVQIIRLISRFLGNRK